MVIKLNGFLAKVQMVYNLTLRPKTRLKCTRLWNWKKPLELPLFVTEKYWELSMVYLGEDEREYTAKLTSRGRNALGKVYKKVIDQLAKQDSEVLNIAFDRALTNIKRKQ